ncbi:MAG: hypothetical protein ABI557_16265, partial [Aureliella sp.]
NVHYKNKPEAWNMRLVLEISTVLGIIGVVAAFGLFYLGEVVFKLDRAVIQTLMYLKLSVAGHLTIFLTRTRGPFWSIRPARILWVAVLGTQTVATLIAVYGLFMTPLGWGWAAFVWGYALLWFLINDRVKLLAYRIFDPVKKARAKLEPKVESKPVTKPETEGDVKTSAKSESNAETKTEDKADLKPNDKPEVKPETKTHPKPEAKVEPKSEAKVEQKPDSKADVKTKADPKAQVEPESETKAESKPDTKTESQPEAKVEPKPETKVKLPSDLTPELVKQVHNLYEDPGRQEVRAVVEMEAAEREIRKDKDEVPK